jgi:hypothetical protein
MTETSKSEILRQRLIELTRDLILIPSTRERPEEIERCVEFVVNHADLPGAVEVRRFREQGSPSVVILPRNISIPEVMLFAHLDVVARPEGTEYRSTVTDGRIYGPGSGDMKESWRSCWKFSRFPQTPSGSSLGIAVTSDEETGGACGTRFLFRMPASVRDCDHTRLGNAERDRRRREFFMKLRRTDPQVTRRDLGLRTIHGADGVALNRVKLFDAARRRLALASDFCYHHASHRESGCELDTVIRRSGLRHPLPAAAHL